MKALVSGLLLAINLGPLGGEAHRRTEEGNRLYADGAWDDALRAYTEAQVAAPDAPELLYDIGNVLYRQENWAAAEEAFARALASAPPDLAARAAYNRGNALFRQERFQDAVDAYRRALEFAPEDLEAKRNLELALARARREEQPQQQQQQQDQQGEGDENEPSEPQPRPDEPGDDAREPPSEGEGESPPDGPPDDASPRPNPGERMTREEAERLLDGIEGEEREQLRARLEGRRARGDVGREKDW